MSKFNFRIYRDDYDGSYVIERRRGTSNSFSLVEMTLEDLKALRGILEETIRQEDN